MSKKLDWNKLKQEYLAGDVEEVSEFCLSQGLSKPEASGNVGKATKGWADERAKLKQAALEAAKAKHIEKASLSDEKLLKMKENVLIIVGNKLVKEADTLPASEIRALWQMIKTELGEASSIQANKTEISGKKEVPVYTYNIIKTINTLENENRDTN